MVICAYTEDRWAQIRAAVASLQHQSLPPLEVIVVVDHNDALLGRAHRHLAGVRVLPSGGPPGLSGARNTGVAAAAGDVVAFLDDDAVASPEWLAQLAGVYADSDVLGVGGVVHARWMSPRPAWFPREFDWTVGCSYPGLPRSQSPVRNFIGANMSFRRSVLEEAGGFLSELGRKGTVPLGCEETELCMRIAAQHPGGRLVHEPAAEVWHTVPDQRATWRYFRSRCFNEGRSKAAVARLRGGAGALGTERRYALFTLPAGVLRALADSVVNPRRLLAAPAIVMGLVFAAAGYADQRRRRGRGPAPAITPSPLEQEQVAPADALRPGQAAAHTAALVGTAGLWADSLIRLNPGAMTDWGLVSVLPVTFWLALAVLTVSFAALVVKRRAPGVLMLAHVVTLVLMLFGTPSITYPELRYSWAYKHIGIVDFILRHHLIGHGYGMLTPYHGWPGFFAINATLTGGSGLASALSYANWGPPFYELLNLGPLVLIFRQFTKDRRLVWTAVWLYLLGNWISQDYFSPQATALFLYLTVVVMVLRWLPDTSGERRVLIGGEGRVVVLPRLGVPGRRVTMVLAVVLVVAIVSAHQLTPYMLVAALGALFVGRARHTGLLALATALTAVVWAATSGRYFLERNASWVFGSIGSFLNNTSTSGGGYQSQLAPAQHTVATIRDVLSLLVVMLAVAGACRRRKQRGHDRALLLLALAPVPVVATNSYGGEMILRCFLFALAPLAFFAASAFFPREGAGRKGIVAPALAATFGVLLLAFTFAYYGSEQSNYFTPAEVAASTWLYQHAPTGSLMYGPDANLPWAFRDYERLNYRWLTDSSGAVIRSTAADPIPALARRFSTDSEPRDYVIITRSQATAEKLGVLPPGTVQRMDNDLLASPLFRVVYRNRDATIFLYIGAKNG